MPASYIKPLTLAYASPHDEKGKRFGKWFKLLEGKSYAVCIPTKGNKDSSKDYSEPTFDLNVVQGTGFIDGDKKWLICTTTPTANGTLFELNLLTKDGSSWKQSAEDSKLVNSELDKWVNDGCNLMILTNGIPTLEVLVSQNQGMLFTNTLRIPFSDTPSAEAIEASLKVINYQLENEGEIPDNDDPDYKLAFESGLASFLFYEMGREYKRSQRKLDIKGELPTSIKPAVLPPTDVQVASSTNSGKGGYSTTYNGFMPTSTRLEDFKNLLANDDLKLIAKEHKVEFINLALSLVGSSPIPVYNFQDEAIVELSDEATTPLSEYILDNPNLVPKDWGLAEGQDPDKLAKVLSGTIKGKTSDDRLFKQALKSEGLDPHGNPWKLTGENLDKALELLDK